MYYDLGETIINLDKVVSITTKPFIDSSFEHFYRIIFKMYNNDQYYREFTSIEEMQSEYERLKTLLCK